MQPVTAVVMLGAAGASEVEQLVHGARRAAAWRAVELLTATEGVERVVIALPRDEQTAWQTGVLAADVHWDIDPPQAAFCFGERLAELIARHNLDRVLYVGGGSIPLLTPEQVASLVLHLSRASGHWAITNNLYSSDWFGLTEARSLAQYTRRLPRDNMLGWVMQQEAGYQVQVLPPAAATRLDIDTPTDLFALRWHPDTPPAVRAYLAETLSEADLARWRAAGHSLATPATQVALIGRVAAGVWRYIESQTRCWLRVYSEERGMTSSGRQAAGVVRSLLAEYMALVGEGAFFESLGELVDAVYFDTRVYLAHHRRWPSAADRFASDLGRLEWIEDEGLRRLTEAALNCSAPVVLGGHGVVSGGMYALIETINAGALP